MSAAQNARCAENLFTRSYAHGVTQNLFGRPALWYYERRHAGANIETPVKAVNP